MSTGPAQRDVPGWNPRDTSVPKKQPLNPGRVLVVPGCCEEVHLPSPSAVGFSRLIAEMQFPFVRRLPPFFPHYCFHAFTCTRTHREEQERYSVFLFSPSRRFAGASRYFHVPSCLSDSQSGRAIIVTHHKVDNPSGESLFTLRWDKLAERAADFHAERCDMEEATGCTRKSVFPGAGCTSFSELRTVMSVPHLQSLRPLSAVPPSQVSQLATFCSEGAGGTLHGIMD